MKKIVIAILLTVLVLPFALSNHVNAATYTEQFTMGYRGDVDENGEVKSAEYVSMDLFNDVSISGKNYNQIVISGGIEYDCFDFDYYGFYIPYETTLKISTHLKFENGAVLDDNAEFTIIGRFAEGDKEFDDSEFYDGQLVPAGYYVIGINHSDNTIVTHPKMLFFFTGTRIYEVEDYTLTLSYEEEAYVPNTSTNLYNAKLNNVSGAAWVNDYDINNLVFQHNGYPNVPSTAFLNDVKTYCGEDNFLNNTYLDKRIYIFDNEMRQGLYYGLNLLKGYVDGYIDEHDTNVENGPWGNMTNSIDNAFIVSDSAVTIMSGVALVTTVPEALLVAGVAAAGASVFNSIIEESYENAQGLLLAISIKTALESDNWSEAYLLNNPEAYLKYLDILNGVFLDMITNEVDAHEVQGIMNDIMLSLDNINIVSDGYAYVDILAKYSLQDSIGVNCGEDSSGICTIYEPYIMKHFELKNYYEGTNNNITKYVVNLDGSDGDNELYFSDFTSSQKYFSETISDYSIFNQGHIEYTKTTDVPRETFEPVLSMSGNKNLTYTVTSGVPISSSLITSGVYAYDDYYGFLKVYVTSYNCWIGGTKTAHFYVINPFTNKSHRFNDIDIRIIVKSTLNDPRIMLW